MSNQARGLQAILLRLNLTAGAAFTDDKMIPPPAQRSMAKRAEAKVVETAASHSVYVSKPKVVADLIAQAAREAK